jgi:hypothetical protein
MIFNQRFAQLKEMFIFSFFQIMLVKNPWHVRSIQAFSCLKCPECAFITKEENSFQTHAVQNHSLSYVGYSSFFFEKLSSNSERLSSNDERLSCNNEKVRSNYENLNSKFLKKKYNIIKVYSNNNTKKSSASSNAHEETNSNQVNKTNEVRNNMEVKNEISDDMIEIKTEQLQEDPLQILTNTLGHPTKKRSNTNFNQYNGTPY